MSYPEREIYDIESLRKRLENLEQTQESLYLQTCLAISQLWQNHWKKLSLRWVLRGKVALRILRKVTVAGLSLSVVGAAGCAMCLALGRWDLVVTVYSEALYFGQLMVTYGTMTYTTVHHASVLTKSHLLATIGMIFGFITQSKLAATTPLAYLYIKGKGIVMLMSSFLGK
jgi:hypothetical protein